MSLGSLAATLLFIFSFHLEAKENIFLLSESHDEYKNPPFHPTRVKFAATLIRVEQIDAASEANPKLTAKFALETSWPDARLAKQDPDSHIIHNFHNQEVDQILSQTFNPSISVINGEMQTNHQDMKIFPDGRLQLNQIVTITVPANLNLLRFPFDAQAFLIQFASTFWDDREVDIIQEIASAEKIIDASNNAWNINYRSFYVTDLALKKSTEEKYSVFNFYIYAERDPSYFIWRLLLPLMAIVMLSWNVFWLHEDKALALGNCFLFLLTVVTFHDTARSMLPVLSYFTFMDAVVFISYAFIMIPTFQVLISFRLEYGGKIELMNNIRTNCQWAVPTLYLIINSLTLLRYFLI
ncbi:MAG: hypothetical protein KC505_10320 [Myxococcales bacterium]|nr:hypothetical protein [Myxococcales bacterium]USN51670.1 MAG: hypothetical protein H6731_04475 [Myxococcales bacterium]